MPNFVSIDTKPYHPETYIGPEQEDEELHGHSAKERSGLFKIRVENTVRWRWSKDEHGQDVGYLTIQDLKTFIHSLSVET